MFNPILAEQSVFKINLVNWCIEDEFSDSTFRKWQNSSGMLSPSYKKTSIVQNCRCCHSTDSDCQIAQGSRSTNIGDVIYWLGVSIIEHRLQVISFTTSWQRIEFLHIYSRVMVKFWNVWFFTGNDWQQFVRLSLCILHVVPTLSVCLWMHCYSGCDHDE